MNHFIIAVFTLIFLVVVVSVMHREYNIRSLREPKPVPYPLEL